MHLVHWVEEGLDPNRVIFDPAIFDMWQIKSVFKKDKTGIRNGQRQYYSDFI